METQITVALIAGLAAVVGPLLQSRFKTDPRQSIERDLKIVELLPLDSLARQRLEDDIERRVRELAWQGNGKRAWVHVILCLIAGGACIYITGIVFNWGFTGSGWARLWIAPSLVAFVLASAFLSQIPGYFKKAPRDKQGNIIPIEEAEKG